MDIPNVNEEGFWYFTRDEFDCQETGENEIKKEFVSKLDVLRYHCGFPFRITSGYRSPNHSIERKKAEPGQHSEGIAADIRVEGGHQRYKLVQYAIALGFTGIGVAKGFVHVDDREGPAVMWSY